MSILIVQTSILICLVDRKKKKKYNADAAKHYCALCFFASFFPSEYSVLFYFHLFVFISETENRRKQKKIRRQSKEKEGGGGEGGIRPWLAAKK